MPGIAVQIYEIQDPLEAESMIELGVDRIGSVILSEKEWKAPAVREAIRLSRGTDVKHSLIPLFNVRDILCHSIEYYQPDIIHFCDQLTDTRGRMLPIDAFVELQVWVKERFPQVEIMRSVPIASREGNVSVPTIDIAKRLESASDSFLTDTWLSNGPVQGFIGITGRTCDWTVAGTLVRTSSIPVILAGGLSPGNVYNGAAAVRPYGVDSCTGTNALDNLGKPVRFKKDLSRVKAFIEETRRAEMDLAGDE